MSNRIEIIKELRALEQFCSFKAVRSAEEHDRFLKDYLADIQDYPFEAIQHACAEWRKSGQTKFPTPGQLIPLIRAKLSSPPAHLAEPWAPLTDEEYGQLSLSNKIRHQTILAQMAKRQAFSEALKQGWDRNVTAAPAIYHQFMGLAGNHYAEAKRLRQYLGDKSLGVAGP